MNNRPLIAIAALAGLAPLASADVLYSNFGPGDTYALDRGATLAYGGPLGGEQHEAAVAFTVTGGDFYFDSAEVAVLHSWGPDLVHVHLMDDEAGAPGAVLESTTASGVTDPFVWAPPMVATFSGSLVLREGVQYWLALATEETDALLAWAENVEDDLGLRASRVNKGNWQTYQGDIPPRPVFRINVTPVPTPGVLTLLALAACGPRRRR